MNALKLAPARQATLTRVYTTRATDALASTTASFAIPLLVLMTTGSTSMTGIAFVLEWTPRLAAFTFTGSLVDRWGAGLMARHANLVRSVGMVTAGVCLVILPASGAATTAVVLAFGTVSGLLAEMSFVALETIGAEFGRRFEHQAHHIQSVNTGIDQGALLAGPLLVGVLLQAGTSTVLFAVAGLSVAAAIGIPGDLAHARHSATQSNLRMGMQALLRGRALFWLVVGLAACNLSSAVLQAATPALLLVRFQRSAADVSMLWSTVAVVALLAVWGARRAIDRWQVNVVGAVAAAVSTVACLAVAMVPEFLAYAIAVVVFMAAEGALTVVLRTLRSQLIPAEGFGSILSASILVVLLPMPLAGVLVAVVPFGSLTLLFPVCAALQAILLWLCFRRPH
ncbi:hypothetical protein AB0B25_03645 [Nocardia sp. NPDC049190]|uniref:hypothetical protein n=1 Tax=Nocardia sp. NPDC049190 TaxID=3155650 RepID=UPI0033C51E30